MTEAILEMRARVALARLTLFGFNPGQRRGPDGRWIKMGGRGSAGRRGTPASGGGPRVTSYARGEVKETPGTTPGAHSSYAFTSDGRTRTMDLLPDRAQEVAQLLAAGQDAVILEGSPRAGGTHYSRIEMQAGPAADDPVRLTLWPPGGPPESVEIEMTKQQARELADRMRANAAYKPQKPLAIPGQPQYAARVKRLQAGVASGVRSEQRVGMGIMGRVDRVQHNDGAESIRKEALGGSSAVRDAAGFHTAADQNAAEELVGLVAVALGMRAPIATPTSATESYIELMPGVPAVTKLTGPEGGSIRVPVELANSPSVRRMAVLDLLIDNGDRNTGNWLVDGDEAIPIDHGMAFAPRNNPDTTAATGPFSAPYINKNGTFNKNNPLTPRDIEIMRARIDSLRPQFAERGRTSWLDQMVHRLDLLAAGARGTEDIFSPRVA
jgi:phosphoinositide 3-/4-kinase-like protein